MKREMLERLHKEQENKIVIGNINVGKTGNVLLPLVDLMIDNEENLFIIDSKEEYYKTYSEKLKETGYNVVVLNLRDTNSSDCWNILDYPKKIYSTGNADLALELIEKLGHELFCEDNKNSDPFWSMSASDFFCGVVLALMEDAKENEVNLSSIFNVFNLADKKFRAGTLISSYFDKKDPRGSAYTSASGTVFATRETRSSIISFAKQKLRGYVAREGIANILSKTSFDFEKLTDKKTAVFVITKDESKTINIIATMFLQQLYRLILQNKVNVKYNFVLDNFDTLYSISGLVDLLSSAVSRNINFYLGTRSYETLRDTYGEYIKHLATIITVNEDDVLIDKNGKVDKVEKGESIIKENLYFKTNVEYPVTVKNELNVFDLERFVKDKYASDMKNLFIENDRPRGMLDVDAIVSTIDKKIAELEKKEKEKQSIKKEIDVNGRLDEIIKNIDDKIEEYSEEEHELTEKQNSIKKQKFVHSKLQEMSSDEYLAFTNNPQPYYEKWKAEYRNR